MDEQDDPRPGLVEATGEVVGLGRLAPGVVERLHVAAVGSRHRRPALAEVPGRDGEHALARRKQVDERRLERAPTGRIGARADALEVPVGETRAAADDHVLPPLVARPAEPADAQDEDLAVALRKR